MLSPDELRKWRYAQPEPTPGDAAQSAAKWIWEAVEEVRGFGSGVAMVAMKREIALWLQAAMLAVEASCQGLSQNHDVLRKLPYERERLEELETFLVLFETLLRRGTRVEALIEVVVAVRKGVLHAQKEG